MSLSCKVLGKEQGKLILSYEMKLWKRDLKMKTKIIQFGDPIKKLFSQAYQSPPDGL